jgi:hypothetical protein
MNLKRLLLAVLAVMLVIFALDFYVHHTLLRADYDAIRSQLRPRDGSRFGQNWFFLSEFLLALPMIALYARLAVQQGSGWWLGLRYGFVIGLLAYGQLAFQYAMMPLPLLLCAKWFGFGVAKCMVCGVVLGAVYKPAFPH